ncbi:MAG TPA: hypothetical protein VF265_09785 [Nevskiaceae bacterium]
MAAVVFALLAGAAGAQSLDHARSIRLGECLIGPGTTQLRLAECAGTPVPKAREGIELRSGERKDVWSYRKGGNVVLIHLAVGRVTRVEVQRGQP